VIIKPPHFLVLGMNNSWQICQYRLLKTAATDSFATTALSSAMQITCQYYNLSSIDPDYIYLKHELELKSKHLICLHGQFIKIIHPGDRAGT
jgi:hypothetical protein